jgi:GNAT superfamily N-acetyltransferase
VSAGAGGPVVVRPRRSDDLPVLVRLLGEQQAATAYPLRWPLPFPPEQFVVRTGERAAWVAEVAGAVAGHVSVSGPDPGDELTEAVRGMLGHDAFALVTVLYVGLEHAGRGLGGRLLDTATDWIRDQGRTPVLDVVPTHDRAVGLYVSRGWREIGRLRPGWLPPDRPALLVMTSG